MKVKIVKYNFIAVVGWLNIFMGIISLIPALVGYNNYFYASGVLGLVIGGLLVTFTGPLKTTKDIDIY